MPDEIRIIFRRVFALDEHYLNGSGELNFFFSVNGVSVGETDRDFVVHRRSYIELEGTWSIVVNVQNLREVAVRMEIRDADNGVRTDFGSITHLATTVVATRLYKSKSAFLGRMGRGNAFGQRMGARGAQ